MFLNELNGEPSLLVERTGRSGKPRPRAVWLMWQRSVSLQRALGNKIARILKRQPWRTKATSQPQSRLELVPSLQKAKTSEESLSQTCVLAPAPAFSNVRVAFAQGP